MPLEAGKLRHRIVIQQPVETQDAGTGAINVTWADLATVWAAIEPLSAREFVASQAEASQVSSRVVIRYRDDVTAKMRIHYVAKDIYFNIEGVLSDKDSGQEYLTLPVSDGTRYEEGDPEAVVPVNLTAPAITGTPTVGLTVNASTGSWANNPTSYTYQWYIDDIAVSGAIASSLVVPNDIGGVLTVGVVAVNTAGDSDEEISAGVIIV